MDLSEDDTLTAAAQATPLVRQLGAFVEWVRKGHKLTQAGNLQVADGKALVEVLGTGDTVDPRTGGHAPATHSATDLGGVDLVFRDSRGRGDGIPASHAEKDFWLTEASPMPSGG